MVFAQTDRILVTGHTGFIGRQLLQHPAFANTGIATLARTNADYNLDLADKAALLNALEEAAPTVIINLAAMTKISDCEASPDTAMQINAAAVSNMAEWASLHDCYLVHLSTDHLFDRGGWALKTEESDTSPPNQYGNSKRAGELAALTNAAAMVVRTHVMGLSGDATQPGFTENMFAAIDGRQPMPLFMDSFATPIHITDFCDRLVALIGKRIAGLVHLGGKEPVSRFGIAAALAQKTGFDARNLVPGSVADIDLPLAQDTGLDSGYAAWLLESDSPDLARLLDLLADDFRNWQARHLAA